LQLTVPDYVPHAARDRIAALGSWLSQVTGALGKIGQDVALMAQNEIGEVALSGAGGSSAMAHKQNPVLAEILVTLARFNAVQVSGLHQALVHEQERSGAAWTLEWMILPQMVIACGASLRLASTLVGQIKRLGQARQ
jgi:3-carboxy-cis,cis-muconate cycloisomerase